MARRTYLKRVSVDDCLLAIASGMPIAGPLPSEQVAVTEALGRVTARVIGALHSNPSAHVAAMDGVAVRSSELEGASADRPVAIRMGRDARAIDTGDAMPAGFDAVVMAEDLQCAPESGYGGEPADLPDGQSLLVATSVVPWKHVRLAGEDIVVGDVLFPRGHVLAPQDLGALLGGGVTAIDVVLRPRVAILPTGDELVQPGEAVPPGGVVEFNSCVVAAMLEAWGALGQVMAPVPDDVERLQARLQELVDEHDVVVVLAGSSAGRGDHTPTIIAELGSLLVHGVDVMPGKPFAFGIVDGKPVLGLPGYPVSTHVAADHFLRFVIDRLLGRPALGRDLIRVKTARKIPSKVGHREIVRVTVGRIDDALVATPMRRGAGVITSLSRAHALLTIPEQLEGVEAGASVEAALLVPRSVIEQTLVVVGSHDLGLDHLDDLMRGKPPFSGLATHALGSLGGILALARGVAHVAGTHLLDPATGEYNLPYLDRYLADVSLEVVTMAHREQGLLVAAGNPKGIGGIADLRRPDVSIVNRQRGSGTRVLFDHLLSAEGIEAKEIRGYALEEPTHVAAAMAVLTERCDVALGIRAVQGPVGLDFVPLVMERFDLVIPSRHLVHPGVERLLTILSSAEARTTLAALPGYDTEQMGRVLLSGGR